MPRKSKLSPEMQQLFKTNPSEFFRRMGAQGGRKRNKKVTPEQLARWGRVGGILGTESRWGKKNANPIRTNRKQKRNARKS